jgi:hypothetical protein
MYKLLHADLVHNDFTYKEGLNVDHLPFRAYGDCEPGGLYYTDLEHIGCWFYWDTTLIADVTVPDDARVHPGPRGDKWKADRLVLSNIRPIGPFLAQQPEALLFKWTFGQGNIPLFDALDPQPFDLVTKLLCGEDPALWLPYAKKTPEVLAWVRQSLLE